MNIFYLIINCPALFFNNSSCSSFNSLLLCSGWSYSLAQCWEQSMPSGTRVLNWAEL